MVKRHYAFTIIELLIVILVIAVLVTLSIVGYSGISSKANVTTLQSDLSNAKKQLLAFQASSPTNSFPTAINCVSPSATEICIKPTGSNTFTYNVNNTSNPKTFNLTSTNGTTQFWINDSSNPLTTPDIVTSGLVLNLDAANPQSYPGSGNTWYDLSGGGNSASLYSGYSYSSAKGGSIVFDGVNNRASAPMPVSASSNQTWEVWASAVAGVGDGYYYIIHNSSFSNATGASYLTIGLRPVVEYFAAFNGRYATMGSGSFGSLGKFVCIHLVWDGVNQSLYLNNNFLVSEALTTYQNYDNAFGIGSYRASIYRPMKGYISKIAIYNRALTQSEITQNFNALRGRYGI